MKFKIINIDKIFLDIGRLTTQSDGDPIFTAICPRSQADCSHPCEQKIEKLNDYTLTRPHTYCNNCFIRAYINKILVFPASYKLKELIKKHPDYEI